MLKHSVHNRFVLALSLLVVGLGLSIGMAQHAQALTITDSQSLQVTAFVPLNPPTIQAVITSPASQSRFKTTPLVVRGTCQAGLLVRINNNGVLAGAITCSVDNDFGMNITLQIGENKLTALNYDNLDQPGPASPAVIIMVDAPSTSDSTDLVGRIDANNIVNTSSEDGASYDANKDYQRLFEGTIIEPAAKVLGVETVVSAKTNSYIETASNVIFGIVVLALIVILL